MKQYLSSLLRGYVANYAGIPKQCWQAITLTFIDSIAVGICFFLSLYFVNILHFDVALAGLLISCYGVGTVIGGIVGGKLSDQVSPRIVSALSLFIQGTAFLFLVKLTSVELLMVNLFLLGLSGYGFATSNDVWMLNQCKGVSDIQLKVVNVSRVAMNLGLGLSGVLIGMFVNYGFQHIFYFFSLILLLSAVYVVLQNKSVWILLNQNENNSSNQEVLYKVTNKKIVMLILGCLFFVGLLISQLSSTYPIYVQNAFSELGIKAVSILFILDTVLIVLFQAPLVNFLKAHNKILIAGLGAFLMGLGMLILSFSYTFFLGIISCIVWTTGEMLFIPMAQLICYEKGEENKKGRTMGLYKAVYAFSMIIGPAVGGVIYSYFGSKMLWDISFLMGGICLIACVYHKEYS